MGRYGTPYGRIKAVQETEMNKLVDGYKVSRQFTEPMAKARTLSKYFKQKIPVEIRKKYYEETVVRAIKDYNFLCQNWLKENVK